jgi:transcriptional regulator with XRE-family HTH domain
VSGLSDYLNSLNRDGWSLRRISQETEKHGHKIDHTTVRKYLRGEHGAPSAEVLLAFALAFDVPVNELRAAADRPALNEPFDLGPEAARLTGPQREAIRHVVRVMLDQAPPAGGHGSATGDEVADRVVADGVMPAGPDDERPWESDPWGLAASRGESEGRQLREQQVRDAEDGGA